MSDLKRSCPACKSWTSEIGEAFRDGEPCPVCGAPAPREGAVAEDYTPTTEQVRSAYAEDPVAEYHDPVNYSPRHAERAFDRWLAAHDAEVAEGARADSWPEGLARMASAVAAVTPCTCSAQRQRADAALAALAEADGLAEVIRAEMAKGSYQMLPNELPYESSARGVADVVRAWVRGQG